MGKKRIICILILVLCTVFVLSACDPAVRQTASAEASASQQAEAPAETSASPQAEASVTPEPSVAPTPSATATQAESAQPSETTEETQAVAPSPEPSPSSDTQAETQTDVQLTTPSGPVKGMQTDGVSVYKGIPYAQPPTGDLRFAPPQDVTPWTDVLDCTEFGDIAVQDTAQEGLTMSEDCLSLNIWTPATGADEKLPVYVWIHGGGFAQGSGAEPSFDGTNFAKEGIIVVTINYRLNALGLFASQETYDEYGTTGNWGLLDQIKALEWVQGNIEAFGGDAQQVTIGGESAGSYSVSCLITSPLAEGLFQRAIMESGSMLGVPGNNYYSRGNLERTIELCEMMGYTFEAADNADGLETLRAADANVLAQLCPLNVDFTSTPAFLMMPVFDGYVMPKDVYGALQNGEVNNVDLLWGYNGNEGSIFIPGDTDQLTYEMLVARMYGYDNQQAVLDHFPVDGDNTSGERAREIFGYGMFSAVMKPYADALAQNGQNVYAYQFNYVTAENAQSGLGAHHGSEIEYAFGNLGEDADEEQQALSDELLMRWANFIKSGDPNTGAQPQSGVAWPAYDAQGTQMLILDKEVSTAAMAGIDDIEFMEEIMFGQGAAYS